MISLIAFLGNMGSEYERTRHNAAWIFARSLSFAPFSSPRRQFKGEYTSLPAEAMQLESLKEDRDRSGNNNRIVHFIKPHTYMNASGESVGEAARFFKTLPENILVVHDELELAPGTLSLKWGGGLGGHNGLRSIKAALGTPDFWRLRFGIGRPTHKDVAGYVLSAFSEDEHILLLQACAGAERLLSLLSVKEPSSLLADWAKILPPA